MQVRNLQPLGASIMSEATLLDDSEPGLRPPLPSVHV